MTKLVSSMLGAPHLPGFGRCGCLLITNNLANDFLQSDPERSEEESRDLAFS